MSGRVPALEVRTVSILAECLLCGFRTDAPNAHGNAARHHKATGHPVTVDVRRRVTYGNPAQPMRGQEELFPDA